MRGHFYAGMRSSQRCESMNRTPKRILDKKVFLYNFVQHYHEELNTLRYEEGRQDYKTTHEQSMCVGILSSLNQHASTIYTRNAFPTLCSEMSYEVYYLVKDVKPTEGTNGPIFYWLQHVEYESSWYLIVNDITHDTMYCCCMKLESVGFPCRHMIVVLKYLHAKKLSSSCILKRWTMYAKEDLDLPKENEEAECNNAITVKARYSSLISLYMNICHRASNDTLQGFKDIRDQFAKMSLILDNRKITSKKRPDNSKEYFGTSDPVIIESGRGQRKKTKVRSSSFVPANVSPSKNELSPEKETTISRLSSTKAFVQVDIMSNFSTMIMNHMPNTYKKGDLSQEPCTHELNTKEDNGNVLDFDWKPYNES
ncbi:hypothetical protein M5689_018717 [Euphorbia peplus]|nr:hypothetical protein M5689_018717 [Euphorbia peplus]